MRVSRHRNRLRGKLDTLAIKARPLPRQGSAPNQGPELRRNREHPGTILPPVPSEMRILADQTLYVAVYKNSAPSGGWESPRAAAADPTPVDRVERRAHWRRIKGLASKQRLRANRANHPPAAVRGCGRRRNGPMHRAARSASRGARDGPRRAAGWSAADRGRGAVGARVWSSRRAAGALAADEGGGLWPAPRRRSRLPSARGGRGDGRRAGAGLAVGVGLRDVDGRRVAVGRRAAAAGTSRECPAARTALGSHL